MKTNIIPAYQSIKVGKEIQLHPNDCKGGKVYQYLDNGANFKSIVLLGEKAAMHETLFKK